MKPIFKNIILAFVATALTSSILFAQQPDSFHRGAVARTPASDGYLLASGGHCVAGGEGILVTRGDASDCSPILQGLQQKGVPIHGIGLQAHRAVNEPSFSQLDSTLKEFTATGLQLQITELDISVYRKEHVARQKQASDADTSFSPEKETLQIQRYKEVFELFRKYRRHITGVTFWNISDRYSWLDNFPVKDRKNHPLLFDTHLQRKSAYEAVVNF